MPKKEHLIKNSNERDLLTDVPLTGSLNDVSGNNNHFALFSGTLCIAVFCIFIFISNHYLTTNRRANAPTIEQVASREKTVVSAANWTNDTITWKSW